MIIDLIRVGSDRPKLGFWILSSASPRSLAFLTGAVGVRTAAPRARDAAEMTSTVPAVANAPWLVVTSAIQATLGVRAGARAWDRR